MSMNLRDCEVLSVRPVDTFGSLRAFVDIRIAGVMEIRNCTVMDGRDGFKVNMPRRVDKEGSWHDLVVIHDPDIALDCEEVIVTAYWEQYKKVDGFKPEET